MSAPKKKRMAGRVLGPFKKRRRTSPERVAWERRRAARFEQWLAALKTMTEREAG